MFDLHYTIVFCVQLFNSGFQLSEVVCHRRRKHGGPGARAPPLFDMSVLNIIATGLGIFLMSSRTKATGNW